MPGKYLGGRPITEDELRTWFRVIERPLKVLVGGAARWGIADRGGIVASLPNDIKSFFDAIVTGEPEAYIYELVKYGFEKARPWSIIDDLSLLNTFAIRGAKIVVQHPNHGYNLVAEIETFRGCPRWIVGGCSFCATKLYGRPRQRDPIHVVKEVEALYAHGVRHFRIGRQADILVYGSNELDKTEWPKPNPSALEKLFYGIRGVAPSLKTLHIDNVNPGTIAHHPKEAEKALKVIVKYHTPGDVAALGIETADPNVVEKNKLKVYPDEALKAIEVINRIGGRQGYNGLPELLPGINFVLGLNGERPETYRLNEEFIAEVYKRGLNVRRINVRQVLVLPKTEMWLIGTKYLDKHRRLIETFREKMMNYSRKFLQRILPPGAIVKDLYVEYYDSSLGVTFARQAGTYPLVAEIPCRIEPPRTLDVAVYGYAGRSLRALPVPLDVNRTPFSLLAKLVGKQTAAKIVASRPIRSNTVLRRMGIDTKYVSVDGVFCE